MKTLCLIFILSLFTNTEYVNKLKLNRFDEYVEYRAPYNTNHVLSEIWIDESVNKFINIHRCIGYLIIDNNYNELILNYNVYNYNIKEIRININESIGDIEVEFNKNTEYIYNNIYSKSSVIHISLEKYQTDKFYITSEITILDGNVEKVSKSGCKEKVYGNIWQHGLKWIWYSEYSINN